MAKKIRMNNPEDTFMKRQFTYLGEIAHEFFNLPGEYIGSECNEYPNVDGGIPRADIVYEVRMKDGSIFMINIEDETSYVNVNTRICVGTREIKMKYVGDILYRSF